MMIGGERLGGAGAHWLSAPRICLAPSDDSGAEPRAPLRILIVEDEAISALRLEDLVRELGHRPVGLAATREAAIATALREKPDLVLMDVRLAHDGDGLATAREIRERLGAPSIFITAHSDADTRARAAEDGAIGFLVKPIDAGEFSAALEQAAGLLRF